MKKFFSNITVQLVIGVLIGILVGSVANEQVISFIQPVKYILGQLIFFMVPLIILAFVTPSITKLKSEASKMLTLALGLAYASSVGSALFAIFLGYSLIPVLNIGVVAEGLRNLPQMLFQLDIPPLMPVMTALVLSLTIGLAVVWTGSEKFEQLLDEFQRMVLAMVNRLLLPILPFFIATNFAILSYEGTLNHHLPVFIKVIIIIIISHFVWLAVLYGLAGLYTGKNPWLVLKHYGPAYLTAIGTMSSAATLAVALRSAKKSDILRDDVTDFSIPLFANIHLCGSVLTEVFFVMVVSLVLYGSLPAFGTLLIFILLLGIFAIGAPGVPGGTVMASLGLVISVLGFDEAGTALLLTIFALQDSFGTACNVTGDGALSLILTGWANKQDKKQS